MENINTIICKIEYSQNKLKLIKGIKTKRKLIKNIKKKTKIVKLKISPKKETSAPQRGII